MTDGIRENLWIQLLVFYNSLCDHSLECLMVHHRLLYSFPAGHQLPSVFALCEAMDAPIVLIEKNKIPTPCSSCMPISDNLIEGYFLEANPTEETSCCSPELWEQFQLDNLIWSYTWERGQTQINWRRQIATVCKSVKLKSSGLFYSACQPRRHGI